MDCHDIVVVRLDDGKMATVTDDRGSPREPAGRMVWMP